MPAELSADDGRAALALAVARRFHETYERLAPAFGYETRRESAVPWDDVPQDNRDLMVAVASFIVGEFIAPLTAERDQARDLAFRAAFGVEEGAADQWGVRCEGDCGFFVPVSSENVARRLLRATTEAHPLALVRSVVGPWKPVAS